MDMLSRDEELQTRLEQVPEWDLVVCDESHRMSAHYYGSEVKRTKRYDMGRRVGNHAAQRQRRRLPAVHGLAG